MVKNKQVAGRSQKWQDMLRFVVGIVVVILINIIASQFFFRLDLTEDKRYTISPATKKLLSSLEDVVYVEVYLEGEFPAGFERLQRSVRETLDEFRVYAGNNLQYRFVDPSVATDAKARGQFYRQLVEKGLQPTNLFANENDQRTEKIIFPGAIVSYGEKELPVMLLRGNQASSSAERLNQSVEGVEYELASVIKALAQKGKPRIGVIRGHGELEDEQIFDLAGALSQSYKVEKVNLPEQPSLQGYDAIIVAKPQTAFSEADKYKIDQYIVNGGKAMFFVNALNIALDSIGPNGVLAMPYELNLDDMFFKYGVRLNANLILDLSAAYIPMFVGYMGDKPQTQPVPWHYYPIINNFSRHPIVRNMDAVFTRFVGSIDTVKATGITKVPLMSTSKYSKTMAGPVMVSFNEARIQPDPQQFSQGPLPIAYMLEGKFRSLYTNRIPPVTDGSIHFKEQNQASKIIVCSDGDLVRNDINRSRNEAYPLGFERLSKVTFANKQFVINALEYLLDEDGVILSRTKEIQLRPLDKVKVNEERNMWQAINLGAPLLLVALFGVTRYYIRKRKYERFK
jgi:ABC-2 type transport system permease protein